MNKIMLSAGLSAGVMLAAGTAQAATCSDSAGSIVQSVRAGEPIDSELSQMTTPSLGGALATSDTAAAIAATGRSSDMTTPAQRTQKALEALAQARIYGQLGHDDACLIALHEGVRLLDRY
jgi:hypothetical protein